MSAERWRNDMLEFARRVSAEQAFDPANEAEMLRLAAEHFTATLASRLSRGSG